MSILSPIPKPLIIREIKKLMKDLIQPILGLIQKLIQPEQGTCFLLTLANIGAIYQMHATGVATTASDLILGAILITYYIVDTYRKRGRREVEK